MQSHWTYLEARPNESTAQLFMKGTRIRASIVWGTMVADNLTVEQAAADRRLSVEAVREAVEYCQTHIDLILEEEKRTIAALEPYRHRGPQ